jgi:late competence protein required for DNA uptake (superfamily II DNA/RNA helicase)
MKRRKIQKSYVALPERAICRRCTGTFTYGRLTKPRLYCDTCAPLERQDTNDFNNNLARQKRHAARMNAWLAHEEALDA